MQIRFHNIKNKKRKITVEDIIDFRSYHNSNEWEVEYRNLCSLNEVELMIKELDLKPEEYKTVISDDCLKSLILDEYEDMKSQYHEMKKYFNINLNDYILEYYSLNLSEGIIDYMQEVGIDKEIIEVVKNISKN